MHKELLADPGFLVYVTRTYAAMIPYLKGFHLTVEMWRGGRDAEGWKWKNHDEHSVSTMVGEGELAADIEDKDEVVVNHRLGSKGRQDRRYTLENGFTTSAP